MIRLRTACLAGLIAAAALAPARARALDLEGALREVASANPTLAARRAMAAAAERRVAPAGAWQSPMLEVGVVNVPVEPSTQHVGSPHEVGAFNSDPMTMKMIGLTQRVPLNGSNGLSRRAAASEAAAESARVAMTGYELFGMTWEAYADAFHAGERAREAEAHRAVMDRLVQSARSRYASGTGRLEDVLRAEAERARVLADLAAYRAEEAAARARLDALRGVTPGAAAEALAPPPPPRVPAGPGAWLAAVTPGLPRLREHAARAEGYRYAARAARRTVWPDLELRGSYGIRETLAGGIPQTDMYSASVAFMLPVFAGGRELEEGAGMDAMARAAEAERRAAELDLARQVTTAHAAAAAAARTIALLADTVVTTQTRAVDASWAAYGAGTTDLWRVLESTHALYAEEIALTRARQDLARAAAQMLSLTGRGDLLGVAVPAANGGGR